MRPIPNRHFPPASAELSGSPYDIQRLAKQASQSAEKIARLGTPWINNSPPSYIDEATLRRFLAARRARSQFFPDGLFGEPAWDMLLDLLAARLGQARVSVTALCAAANVPATTALRWIKILEAEHLVRRHNDPLDGRRHFLELTHKGEQSLRTYFASIGVEVLL